MKWTKPGHELDEIGCKFLQVKNICLFGFDDQSADMLNFLKWIDIEKDFNIKFVWDESEHEDECVPDTFCDKPVVVYNAKSKPEDIIDTNENTIVVLKRHEHTRRRDLLLSKGITQIFYMEASHLGKNNFIQNFVCVYMMYKYGKLLSHWTNYLVTYRCNLNCKHCLNFNNYLEHPMDVPFDEFKKHFDTLFEKFDYLYSLHFTGGETQLTKNLSDKIMYLKENYGERIYDFFVISNGTIIPPDENLEAIKAMNGWMLIDDYSDSVSVSRIPEIREKLDNYGIKYVVSKASYWYDLAIAETDYSDKDDEEMEKHKDSCHNYLHEFGEGNIYACCYQQYAHRAGQGPKERDDYISISDIPKMEILEFRQGYTKRGYTSLCRSCRGLGESAKKVAVAEQIPRNRG